MNISQVEILKENQKDVFDLFATQNDKTIISVLEKMGRLRDARLKNPLLFLIENRNAKIRELAIKNLAKLNDIFLLNIFIKTASEDINTNVKRESVSAIGRLRDKSTIPALINFLSDKDPKIVMQAIRGLLVFSNNQSIKNELKKLIKHPNEIIRAMIEKEFYSNSNGLKKRNFTGAKQSNLFFENLIIQGDTNEILKYVPNDTIQLTFTSPPYYNARDYSIYQSYQQYLDFLENVFKQVHRITAEGRFFVLNTSPIIISRVSRAHSSKRYPIPYDIHHKLVKIGWEFIDDIIWVKPEASVKNRNAGFLQHRKPLAYKPNAITEHLMVYRKKTDKLIDWNIRQYDKEKVEKSKVKEEYETNNVWHIDPAFDKVHSAVFPLELCDRVIKYYSFVGDIVFDPFAGSGTLGKSATRLERNFFLTESNKEYIQRIKEKLKQEKEIFDNNKKQINFISFEEFKKSYK